jgi:hypothetical protein
MEPIEPIEVRVRESPYSNISPGAQGVAVGTYEEGYCVAIMGDFTDATGKKAFETRCIWFAPSELEGVSGVGSRKTRHSIMNRHKRKTVR